MFLKPSHFFQGLVAKPADVIRNCRHSLRMLSLKLGLSKPDKYLAKLQIADARAIWATAVDGEPLTCVYCKHAIARFTFTGGWTAETCSAYGLDKQLASQHTTQWVEKLQNLYETNDTPEFKTNTGDLQRTQ